MAQSPLTAAEMEASLHSWLDTEFTFFKVEELAVELAVLARNEQDFILDWIRRIASTHITLAWQFGRRAPALLPRMERRLLEAWAAHTCDVFDRTGLQTALRVMEEVDSFDDAQHKNDAAGALFEDIAPILGNFVCGLSGRRLRIEEGDAAWTDGERIVLPPLIAALPDLDDNFRLAKITVALLWAQTRYGTLRADLAGIAAAYADPERALARLYALETLRLTARIARELPGLYRQLQRLRELLDPHYRQAGADSRPAWIRIRPRWRTVCPCWMRPMRKPTVRSGATRDACARMRLPPPALPGWTRKRRGCASNWRNCWKNTPQRNPLRNPPPKRRPIWKSSRATKMAGLTSRSRSTAPPSLPPTASSNYSPRSISILARSRRNT